METREKERKLCACNKTIYSAIVFHFNSIMCCCSFSVLSSLSQRKHRKTVNERCAYVFEANAFFNRPLFLHYIVDELWNERHQKNSKPLSCLVTYRNNLLITDMLNRQDGGSMPRASYYRMLIRMMDVFTNDGMRFSVQNPQSLNHFDQLIL